MWPVTELSVVSILCGGWGGGMLVFPCLVVVQWWKSVAGVLRCAASHWGYLVGGFRVVAQIACGVVPTLLVRAWLWCDGIVGDLSI
jgi:hypothetical protein